MNFDRTLPLSRSDGKAVVVSRLQARFATAVAVVGDGMTDACACPPAAVFIGFGANVDRPAVRAVTPYFCTDTDQLERLFRTNGLLPR